MTIKGKSRMKLRKQIDQIRIFKEIGSQSHKIGIEIIPNNGEEINPKTMVDKIPTLEETNKIRENFQITNGLTIKV